MIDLSEELIPLSRVCDLIPSSRRNKRLALATVWRWCLNGARGKVLESVLVGGSRYVTRTALEQFMHAGNGDAQAQAVPAQVRTERQRRKSHAQACAQLDRAGIA